MRIIVGLGNIGEKYEQTRHNAGFLFLDFFEKHLKAQGIELTWKMEEKFKAIIGKLKLNNEDILLVKPITFMNLSGESIQKILNFYKETTENLIVIYDDIDLPLGKIRFRENGSAGTHNGMKSVIQQLGTENFKRLRIGIESRGEITPKEQDLHSFVLSHFTEPEAEALKVAFKEALAHLPHD